MPKSPLQPLIAPSILSADLARLGEDVQRVLAAGADIVHFDVMDNHYVPNLTFGPAVCAALKKFGVSAPLDVHLMVEPVDALAQEFAKAGASYITFHPEASRHVDRSLQAIRDAGCRAGLVFNPATPLDVLGYVMDKVDMILIMSVNPGFGGQSFIRSALKKLTAARGMIDNSGREIRLEREDREHRRDRRCRRRYLRRRFRHLWRPRLCCYHRRHASRNRQGPVVKKPGNTAFRAVPPPAWWRW
jgi:ribulose-phosphate 3-epimerase